jgi:hypothetical protein
VAEAGAADLTQTIQLGRAGAYALLPQAAKAAGPRTSPTTARPFTGGSRRSLDLTRRDRSAQPGPTTSRSHSQGPRPTLGHRVVILDAAGSVTAVNDAAERWLAQIPDSDWPSSCQLPLPLLAAAAAAGTAGAGQSHRTPTVRMRTIRGDWLSVHASRLHGSDGQSTVLVLEEPGPGDVASLILDSHGVTAPRPRWWPWSCADTPPSKSSASWPSASTPSRSTSGPYSTSSASAAARKGRLPAPARTLRLRSMRHRTAARP